MTVPWCRHHAVILNQTQYQLRFLTRSCSSLWSSLLPCLQICSRPKPHAKILHRSYHRFCHKGTGSLNVRLSRWSTKGPMVMLTRHMHTMNGVSPQVEINNSKPQTSLLNGGQEVVIQLNDGKELRFHAVWLRYNCKCSECVQDHSGQRLVETADINPETAIENAYIDDGSQLFVRWTNHEHEGHVPLDFLQQHCYHDDCVPVSRDQVTHLPSMDYKEVMSSDLGLLRWLRHINDHGMCLVRGAPTDMTSLSETVEKIGPIQETIYGKLFEVRSEPNPINVAYTTVKLNFHMDLVYYESPPGLQFLHCIRFDDCVKGGENYMLNVVAVAERFRKQHPDDFHVLTTVPATFQKVHFARANPVVMKYQRPHINLNHKDEIVNVIWSPQFEGPLAVDYADVQPYYRAYHRFSQAINTAEDRVELRLVPGDILSFNNRTILHARKAFELHGGERHFQGCYLNIDEYKSKLAVLAHLHGDKKPLMHVGNQCWF